MRKLKYILLFSIILFGCKPQKSIQEYKYITKTDTIVRTQINTIYQSVNDTTYIENPCDSTGILNEFYAKISIPFGKVQITNSQGRIKAVVTTSQMVSSIDKEKTKSTSNSIAELSKEIIKYRIPNWAIIFMFTETLIIVIYLWIKLR